RSIPCSDRLTCSPLCALLSFTISARPHKPVHYTPWFICTAPTTFIVSFDTGLDGKEMHRRPRKEREELEDDGRILEEGMRGCSFEGSERKEDDVSQHVAS